MFEKLVIRLAVMMLILLVATSAWAATTGKISGKITDKETGEPLPGVSVLRRSHKRTGRIFHHQCSPWDLCLTGHPCWVQASRGKKYSGLS